MLIEGFFALLSGVLLFSSRLDTTHSFPHPLSPEKEAEYLNRNFGFDYTAGKLAEAIENCRGKLGKPFGEQFRDGLARMEKINGKLAAAYAELLGLACDIVIASDGEITPEEIEEAKRIKSLV